MAQRRPLPAGRQVADQRDESGTTDRTDAAAPVEAGGHPAVERRAPSRASRVHGATFLGVIVVVQLAWLLTLGYAFLRLIA